MEQIINRFEEIEFDNFKELLNEGGWSLSIGINDRWDAERHLQYIIDLKNGDSDLIVQFNVDNKCLTKAEVLDVYICPKTYNEESTSSTKHIRFIKTQKTT